VLDQGRAPPSRAYKTGSRRPCITPKPHWPSSLPPETPTATARAVSIAGRPPPSISLHNPFSTKVRSGMSCPRPPLRFAPPPGRPHGLGRRRPFPPTGWPPCRLPSLFGSEEEESHLPHNPLLYFLFDPRPSHFFSLSQFH
jgi:hypothetical protein